MITHLIQKCKSIFFNAVCVSIQMLILGKPSRKNEAQRLGTGEIGNCISRERQSLGIGATQGMGRVRIFLVGAIRTGLR